MVHQAKQIETSGGVRVAAAWQHAVRASSGSKSSERLIDTLRRWACTGNGGLSGWLLNSN